jgi:hypothetical protein
VTLNSAALPTKKSDGRSWDFGGGAPDPFWIVALDGKQQCRSSVTKDTFKVNRPFSCRVVLESGATFQVYLYDNDMTEPDLILGLAWQGNDAIESVARISGQG